MRRLLSDRHLGSLNSSSLHLLALGVVTLDVAAIVLTRVVLWDRSPFLAFAVMFGFITVARRVERVVEGKTGYTSGTSDARERVEHVTLRRDVDARAYRLAIALLVLAAVYASLSALAEHSFEADLWLPSKREDVMVAVIALTFLVGDLSVILAAWKAGKPMVPQTEN